MRGVKHLSEEQAGLLGVLAARIVPETRELEEAGRERFYAIVDRSLGDRRPRVRRQLAAFLGLVRWLPVLRWGTPFERLAGERQDRFLGWLQDCPVGRLRQGFWALKVLVFMGYYGQVETWPRIGYSPLEDGNEALHARA